MHSFLICTGKDFRCVGNHKGNPGSIRRRLLLMLAPLALFATTALAQKPEESKGITITARPAGTIIKLDGDYTFMGKAPFSISQNLSGIYRLSASKPGYEKQSVKLNFGAQPSQEIAIHLQPITKWKAGYRSLLIPGWGQRYKGASRRGLLFTGLALGAGVGTLVTVIDYNSDLDAAKRAGENYVRVSGNFEQAQAAYDKWQTAYKVAQDSYDRRQRSLMITAGVWALNLLDALFLPPAPGSEDKIQTARLGYNQSKIELQVSF